MSLRVPDDRKYLFLKEHSGTKKQGIIENKERRI